MRTRTPTPELVGLELLAPLGRWILGQGQWVFVLCQPKRLACSDAPTYAATKCYVGFRVEGGSQHPQGRCGVELLLLDGRGCYWAGRSRCTSVGY